MSGDFSTIMAAGVQGSVQADRAGGVAEENIRRSDVSARLQESRQRAEKSAGVGSAENETRQSSGERDGDGREYVDGKRKKDLISSELKEDHKKDQTSVKGSIDLTGHKGKKLDFLV